MLELSYFSNIRELAEYEVWCNFGMVAAASKLSRQQLHKPFPIALGTIHKTLFHTLTVMEHWTAAIAPERVDPPWPNYDADRTLVDLQDWNRILSSNFLRAIDDSHAIGLLDRDRRLVQVFHLVTHGTHHRTQVISMLRMLGVDPPFEAGDFAGWQRTRAAAVDGG